MGPPAAPRVLAEIRDADLLRALYSRKGIRVPKQHDFNLALAPISLLPQRYGSCLPKPTTGRARINPGEASAGQSWVCTRMLRWGAA